MLERVFRDPVLSGLKTSVFNAPLEDLAGILKRQRYSLRTIYDYLRCAGHFAHWLQSRVQSESPITKASVDQFLNQHLRDCQCPVPRWNPCARARLSQFFTILRSYGLASEMPMPVKTPVDRIIEEYAAHLRVAQGATAGTCVRYTFLVREFLESVYASGPVDLSSLRATHIIDFVSCRTKRVRPNRKGLTAALRSFLRFGLMRGLCAADIVDAVPTAPCWKLSRLPKSLTAEQAHRLLDCFNRSTSIGRRNYAITLCLLRLGLRAGEVAGLSLDDVGWQQATVTIRPTKVRRSCVLPLPGEVARAIAVYLRYGRPKISGRQLFVRHLAPMELPITGSAIRQVVRSAFRQAGIDTPSQGSHVLRHTAATLMVQRGATIKEVADVLRHRHIDTTMMYTKVDLATLSLVALPWPEVRR